MITDATRVRVGDSDLFAPRVGLGTAALGNFLQATTDADAVAVISQALAGSHARAAGSAGPRPIRRRR